jgi:hypothetical protein
LRFDSYGYGKPIFEFAAILKKKQLGSQARKKVEEHFFLKRYIDVFENEYAGPVQRR